MKKLLFTIACLLLLWPPEAKSQPLQITSGYFVENDCDGINNRAPGVVMCIQLQNSSGRTPGEYRWNGTSWQRSDGFYVGTAAPSTCKVSEVFFKTDATPGENIYGCTAEPGTWTLQSGAGGLTGHVFHDEGGAALTQRSDVNCVGTGITCSDVGGQTQISVAAGAESDPIVGAITGVPKGNGAGVISPANATDLPYTPAGSIAATNVGAAIAEHDSETTTALSGKQPLNTNLTTFGALNTDGVARRAAGVWVSTDPSLFHCGVDAAPRGLNADLTPFGCTDRQPLNSNLTVLAAHPLAANTLTLLDSANFAAWRTNLSLVPGVNIQAFDAQLTDIAGLTPTDNRMVGSDGTNLIFYTIEDCPAGLLSYNAGLHKLPCNASSGGIGGSVSSGPFTVGSGSDTVTNSQWVQEGVSGIAVTGQSTFGTVGTNDWKPDYSLITGHKVATYPNATGTVVYADNTTALDNKTISYASNAITLPDPRWFDAAACQDATASYIWDYLAAEVPAVACDTGSNTQKAYLAFDDSTDEAIQFKFRLGAGFQSINWIFRWKGVATAGAVGWCVQLVRVPDGATSDPAFPAQSAGNCVSDTAKGTTLQENEATITSVTCTSCVAGDLVYGRLSRDADGGAVTDGFSGDAFLLGWERTIIYTH